MRIPFGTEKVTDMIIRSLRASGIVADDPSADAIRAVANNATETELDNIAAGLNYGTSAEGGAGIVSNADVDIFIDADELPIGSINFFRITQNQSSTPVTDPFHELMTLSSSEHLLSFRETDGPKLIIGPRASLSPSTGMYAELKVGTSTSDHYFNLFAGPMVFGGSSPGFRMEAGAGTNMDIRSYDEIQIRNLSSALHGGWTGLDLPNLPSFHIGNYETNQSIALETLDDDISGASVKHFQLRVTKTDSERKLYLRGSQSTDASNSAIRVAIGGKEGETWGDPGDAHQDTTVLIVSPKLGGDTLSTLRLKQRSLSLTSNQEIFAIESDDTSDNVAFMMRVTRTGATVGPAIFSIDMDGNVRADGTFASPASDVAEWVQVEGLANSYSHGSVVVVSSNGKMEKSSSVADPKVIGVTVEPTFPALLMGKRSGFDESAAVDLGLTPLKTGSLTELVFSGDVTDNFAGVAFLRVGPDVVPIDPPTYDAAGGKTTVAITGGQTVVRYLNGTSIKKDLVPITDELAMTVCGIVPVRSITTNGTISPGDLLVSAGYGRATKSPDPPVPGTIVGKALATLTDDMSGTVTGTVKALVNLQ